MTRTFFVLGYLMLCLGLFSCYDENNTYGSRLVESVFRNISTDTMSVMVTSVKIDSVETSGVGVGSLGKYTHSLWGTVSAETFVAYEHPSYSTDADETVVLDSVVLRLEYYNHAFLGDTMVDFSFSVYPITEKIVLNDHGYLYGHDSVAYDHSSPLATYIFKPRPDEAKRLEVRLSDDFGEDLLTRFHARDDRVYMEDQFIEYFKGLALVPDETVCESMLSFAVADTSAAIGIYYHLNDEYTTERQLWIFPNTETQFSHIDHDRSNTTLANLEEDEFSSEETNHLGFLFGGIGWYTRLEFPYLNTIMETGTQVEIESASLVLYPQPDIYSEFNALPDSVYLYIADENNVVIESVTDYLGTEVQKGTLVNNDMYEEGTYYYFDVTEFMQDELGAFGRYKHNLQLVFSSSAYSKTFRNLTICDKDGKYPITLNLIFKVYESY